MVAYNWEVVYDIDRSDVTSVLENFENTYTQVEVLLLMSRNVFEKWSNYCPRVASCY